MINVLTTPLKRIAEAVAIGVGIAVLSESAVRAMNAAEEFRQQKQAEREEAEKPKRKAKKRKK